VTQDAATNPASELAAAARELLGKLAQPSTEDPEHSADPDLWRRVSELGWAGISVPDRHGGLGLGWTELCAVVEECGRVLLGLPLADSAVCALAIELLAPHQAGRFLPAMAAGDLIGTMAFDSETTARREAHGWRIEGEARFVVHGAAATVACVFVPEPEPLLLLLDEQMLAGVARRDVSITDRTRPVSLLTFDTVLGPEAVVGTGATAVEARDLLRARRATALAAECAGGADGVLGDAAQYAMERRQFGRVIGSFQAVKHRLANDLALVEHARTAARFAAACPVGDRAELMRRAAIAKSYCGDAFVRAASDGIQIHGGIGFTWEHPAHLFYKRATVNAELVWPSTACREYLRRSWFDDSEPVDGRAAPEADSFGSAPTAGEHDDLAEDAIVEELRAWLAEQGEVDWIRFDRHRVSMEERAEASRAWERSLGRGKWLGLTWPAEHGGRGLSMHAAGRVVRELVAAGAPELFNQVGLDLVGPAIVRYGTDDQKKRFLPALLEGEVWCQGFSEPDAGSDLASLRTAAVRDGDSYVIDGQKVWSTFASRAAYCILLARTDPTVPKHRGISCFLLPMNTRGLTVRPIRDLTGDIEFFELFFDGCTLGQDAMLGAPGQGWEIANAVLANERTAIFSLLGVVHRDTLDLVELTRARPRRDDGQAELESRAVKLCIDEAVVQWSNERATGLAAAGLSYPRLTSVMKVSWSELHQEITRLAIEAGGLATLLDKRDPGAVNEGRALFQLLRARAETIYAGTSEIQRNIIGERVLGLPREPRP
jgi:alkylation response protein AidB-like acyl-CoA dehydrogenase